MKKLFQRMNSTSEFKNEKNENTLKIQICFLKSIVPILKIFNDFPADRIISPFAVQAFKRDAGKYIT